jgi:histone H3/H4
MSSREYTLITYLNRIFRQVWPENMWSEDAKVYMNELVHRLVRAIIAEAIVLAESEGKKTLMLKEIELAFRLVIHGEVGNSAVQYARVQLDKFERTKPTRSEARSPRGGARSPRKLPVSTSSRAGLQMSVPRINSIIKEQTELRLQEEVGVYLAAALEEVCRQIFASAGTKTFASRRKTVTAAFINEALKSDLVCLF